MRVGLWSFYRGFAEECSSGQPCACVCVCVRARKSRPQLQENFCLFWRRLVRFEQSLGTNVLAHARKYGQCLFKIFDLFGRSAAAVSAQGR